MMVRVELVPDPQQHEPPHSMECASVSIAAGVLLLFDDAGEICGEYSDGADGVKAWRMVAILR